MTDENKKSHAVAMGNIIVSLICDTPEEAVENAKSKLRTTALPANCRVVEIYSIDMDVIYKKQEQKNAK